MNDAKAKTIKRAEIPSQSLEREKKSQLVSFGTSLRRMDQTSIVLGRRRSNHITMIRRVTKMAVKTDVIMPKPRVMAKPRTGPEPMTNRITAVINVVMLASMARAGPRADFNSSRIRSKISTLASNRHTDCQNDPRDTGQGKRRTNHAEQAKDQTNVDDQRDIGEHTKQAIA
ncbi:hypothetical protein GQR58_000433 [Nymphon striatum]|nr:hypothetical protein GQR58_000433 [Nymphon striatum]